MTTTEAAAETKTGRNKNKTKKKFLQPKKKAFGCDITEIKYYHFSSGLLL